MASQWPYDQDGVTNVNKAFAQGLVMGQSHLAKGGIPSTNGTLTITQPATTATYNDGTVNFVTMSPNSTSLTFTASRDTYVDLDTAGTYHQTAVTNGAGAPAVFANAIRLYKAVSGASSVTSVVPLLPGPFSTANGQSQAAPVSPYAVSAPDETAGNITTYGGNAQLPTDTLQQAWWRLLSKIATATASLVQTAIGYDATEAASASGTTSLLSNLNHIRQGLSTLFGDTFAHLLSAGKAAILQDGTNAAATVTMATTTLLPKWVGINSGTTIKGHLSVSSNVPLNNLAAGGTMSVTTTVTGAASGDSAYWAWDSTAAYDLRLVFSPLTVASNLVSFTIYNPTASNLNVSGNIRIDVWKH